MLVSIITVCRNAEKVIGNTVKSVIEQTYSRIEYIIVDGASTDGTLSVIEEIKGDYPIKVVSEPDEGLYDAMNKGVRLARGKYIYFLNAGDTLYNNRVVEDIVGHIKKAVRGIRAGAGKDVEKNGADAGIRVKTRKNAGVDVIYGDICYVYPDGKQEIRKYGQSCSKKIYYLTGDCINHQAMFTRKKCFESNLFDTEYRICADREWMIRVCKKGYRFVSVDMLVCNYSLDDNSVSIQNKELSDREAKRCIIKHFPMGYPIYGIFSFMRNNRVLQKMLHGVYRVLYIRNKQ